MSLYYKIEPISAEYIVRMQDEVLSRFGTLIEGVPMYWSPDMHFNPTPYLSEYSAFWPIMTRGYDLVVRDGSAYVEMS